MDRKKNLKKNRHNKHITCSMESGFVNASAVRLEQMSSILVFASKLKLQIPMKIYVQTFDYK